MRYYLFVLLIILGCSNHSENRLAGKWKLKNLDIMASRETLPVEFSKTVFIVHPNSKTPDTFDYILTVDTLIFSKAGDKRKSKALISFIDQDSIMIRTSSGRAV